LTFIARTRGEEALIRTVNTDENGRTAEVLLTKKESIPGSYLLIFYVEDYNESIDHPDAGRFLNNVPIAFVIENMDEKYHAPLLVSPWSYSTYRGS